MSDQAAAWCVRCGGRYTAEEIEGAEKCPGCGSTGVPCDPQRDVWVQINWHELRILGIWAGNWADRVAESGEDRTDARATVTAITRRLEAQHPEIKSPLTMQGEVRLLKEAFPGGVESNVPPSLPIPVNGPGAVGHARRTTRETPERMECDCWAQEQRRLSEHVTECTRCGRRWTTEDRDDGLGVGDYRG